MFILVTNISKTSLMLCNEATFTIYPLTIITQIHDCLLFSEKLQQDTKNAVKRTQKMHDNCYEFFKTF